MTGPVEIRCCHGMVIVRPGDRLVVAADIAEPGDVEAFTQDIAQRLPGVDVLVLSGVSSLAVRPAKDNT